MTIQIYAILTENIRSYSQSLQVTARNTPLNFITAVPSKLVAIHCSLLFYHSTQCIMRCLKLVYKPRTQEV
jgi:hypothetical protein